MTALDPKLAAILKDAGLGQDAVWLHKQSGKYIAYHWACEAIGAHRGIVFQQPHVVHADPDKRLAVIVVTGQLGDKLEWSFGEASPDNIKTKDRDGNPMPTYPFAMAEKRAKDRVVLKLVGLHGMVYSEEEAEDFKPEHKGKTSDSWHGPLGITELKAKMREFAGILQECKDQGDYDQLLVLLSTSKGLLAQCERDLPSWWGGFENGDVKGAKDAIEEAKEALAGKERI